MVRRITITLPDELVRELDALAEPEGLSRSGIIREASSHYVAEARRSEELERRRTGTQGLIDFLEQLRARPALDDRPVLDLLREGRPRPPEAGDAE